MQNVAYDFDSDRFGSKGKLSTHPLAIIETKTDIEDSHHNSLESFVKRSLDKMNFLICCLQIKQLKWTTKPSNTQRKLSEISYLIENVSNYWHYKETF